MRHGVDDDAIQEVTAFDPWFLGRIREIVDVEEQVRRVGLPRTGSGMRRIKAFGFTDARLSTLTGIDEADVRRHRLRLGVEASFKRIDTCAAEFESRTPYMYSTYETPAMEEVECESWPTDRKKIVILGGGPDPHRPGNRVRLLLLPCLLLVIEIGVRDDHGQLQSRNRQYGL